MQGLRFSWNEAKAAANRRKHGVDFDEAATAFGDDFARLIADPQHSDGEDRFVLLGMSAGSRIVIVCHCYRDSEQEIRIISARRATRAEQQQYWKWRYES